MRRFFLLLIWSGWSAVISAEAAPPATDLIAQVHFAGAAQISADTNAIAFTNLWCSPEAQALRTQTLDKLSRVPYEWLKAKLTPETGDGTAQLRPLLDDLLSAEWYLKIRAPSNAPPEYVLAIRLDAEPALRWDMNLKTVLESWTQLPARKSQIAGQTGWRLEKHEPPNSICCVHVGDWVVFGCGQNELPLTEEIIRKILADKRPAPSSKNDWLTADLDWPRLAQLFPVLSTIDLPEMRWQAIGRDGNLQFFGKLIFREPLPISLEKWRLPTNTIHLPFVGFTATRGIAPWLEKQTWAQPYEIAPVPNQVFFWAMAQIPLQTFAAVPVPNASRALVQLDQQLSVHTNWQSHFTMPVTMVMTNNQISWRGMPFIAPNVLALHEPAGDFLLVGFFPNGPKTKPLPPELLTELGRSNLVYYDWEITGERLKQLPQLTQLGLMLTRHKQLDAQSAAAKWLNRIGPSLGVTATEITQTAPDELTFQRKAPGGLTAIELTALANWLEAANFPGCDLRITPPRFRPGQKPVKLLSFPGTPVPH